MVDKKVIEFLGEKRPAIPYEQWQGGVKKMEEATAAKKEAPKVAPQREGRAWSRPFLDSYKALEGHLRGQGDVVGLDVLDSFGDKAEEPGAFGSARLSLRLRDVEDHLKGHAKGLKLLDVLGRAFDDMVDAATVEDDWD